MTRQRGAARWLRRAVRAARAARDDWPALTTRSAVVHWFGASHGPRVPRPGFAYLSLLMSTIMAASLLLTPQLASAQSDLSVVGSDFVRMDGTSLSLGGSPWVMHGFNYYPRDYAWSAMNDWDWSEVDTELGLAEGLGANTIRTVVDYGFSTGHHAGDWTPSEVDRLDHATPEYLAAMDMLLTIASSHHLRVVFSLFDFMPGWELVDQAQYAPASTYVTDLVAHFVNDPRIAAWDILNEGDLLPDKFPATSQAAVLSFYAAMSTAIKSADHRHLVTAGFGNIDRAHLSQGFVDFISFHYYGDQASLTQKIDTLRGHLNRAMPIVAGELGAPSAGNRYATTASHTTALGAYLDSALDARDLAGALIWTLVDAAPPKTSRTHGLVDPLDFGIFDRNLQPKASADLVRREFAGGCGNDQRIELHFPSAQAAASPTDSRALAIGVHQLSLLRADGTPLDQVTFGTLQADVLAGRGWYANESWGQWAGDTDGTATLCLPVPAEAATLSLTAHAIQPDTELQVWIDGTLRGTVNLQTSAQDFVLALTQPSL